ncbi:MAG: DUF2889 domain-containing protein [Proteobacteria bacterium]|nr:DUF2889 domain-containing protein [Pseudomonadota bacterium]MBI3496836.1 DUF2889 domain-containing protein [Pseudomonadota bacterium]
MPLSPAVEREHLHLRQIECRGFRRADGLWDIEGHMTDSKTYGFPNKARGRIEAGEALHNMWLRITIDDHFVIRAVEAVTDAGPFSLCGDITPNFQRLCGLRIGAGFTGKTRELLGGVEGCTHLVELLGPIATTAFQTLFSERRRRADGDAAAPAPSSGQQKRPRLLDSCHAFRADGPIVKDTWPGFYTGQ